MSKRTKIMVFGVDGVVGRQCALQLFERGYHIMAVGAVQPPGQGEGIWQRVAWASWRESMEGCAAVINALAHTVVARRWTVEEMSRRTQAILSAAMSFGVRRVIYLSHRVTLGQWAEGDEVLDSASHHVPGQDVPGWVEALHIAEAMHRRSVVEDLDCLTLVPSWMVSDLDVLRRLRGGAAVAPDAAMYISTPYYIAQLVRSALERGQAGRRYVCPGAVGTWRQLGDRVWVDEPAPKWRVAVQRQVRKLGRDTVEEAMLDVAWVVGALEGSWAEGALGVQGLPWDACFEGFSEQQKT